MIKNLQYRENRLQFFVNEMFETEQAVQMAFEPLKSNLETKLQYYKDIVMMLMIATADKTDKAKDEEETAIDICEVCQNEICDCDRDCDGCFFDSDGYVGRK